MSTAPKGKILHLDKLFGGKTAEEVYREAVLKGRYCNGCRAPASHRAVTFAPVKEILQHQGEAFLLALAQSNGGSVPIVPFRVGGSIEKYVRISEAHSCEGCFKELQHQLAKSPSWVQHEIDSGMPSPTRPIIQVGG